MDEQHENFWGIPIGKEVTFEAFVKDIWDPDTEEVFTPKNFIGLGWGVNFYAIARKVGLL